MAGLGSKQEPRLAISLGRIVGPVVLLATVSASP